MSNPVGIVLAGGESRRMGTDKATRVVGGRPMAEWVVAALRSHLDDVFVVGRAGSLAGVESRPDAWPGRRGPLAGLATALQAFGRPVILAAVDQPLLRVETVQQLIEAGDSDRALIPIDSVPQVTCARYPAAWAEAAVAAIEADGSIRDLLGRLPHLRVERAQWRAWGEDGRSWFSCDSQGAILEAERRFRVDLS